MLHQSKTGLVMVCLLLLQARAAQAQAPQQFTGVGADGVTTAIAAFKSALGRADNGASPGTHPGGFRQITWDDVPDQFADPNQLPPDFFNVNSPRGLVLGPWGYVPFYKVSANASNPSSAPTLFGHPDLYAAYSPQRIFAAGGVDSAGFVVNFQIPGSTAPATVSGFGAVFTNVERANLTSLEFFDIDGHDLGTFFVPASSGHQTLAFLGVTIPGARIASVVVNAGTNPLQVNEANPVALDDFIYGEPQPPAPTAITITTPTSQSTLDATGPFLTVAGRASNVFNVTWTNDRGGSGQAAGGTRWSATNIPIAAGPNVITFAANGRSDKAATATKVLRVNGNAFAYHLAEGSTGNFFDTDISIANPNPAPAPITLTFLREDGGRVEQTDTIAAMSRKTIHVDSVPGLEATAFSSVVTSIDRLPLVVERTMFWGQQYYGSKGATAIDTPSETWLFAEGVENDFFNTFILLQNPNTEPATATLTFELALGEAPVTQSVPLPPLSRVTVDAGSIPALVGRSFGLSVQADRPIIAERSTYFETTPTQLWGGGHGSPGVTAPSQTWLFAEGATGAFRDTFLLLSNPNDEPTNAHLFFYGGARGHEDFDSGVIPPHGRVTIPVETLTYGPYRGADGQLHDDYPLGETEFVAQVTGNQGPIVAERAMYWVGAPGPWADGTSTFGITDAGLRWGFAEGRVGGPLEFHTYIRLFATASNGVVPLQPGEVKVTFLRTDGVAITRNYTVPLYNFFLPFPPAQVPFITIDANTIPELDGQSFGTLIESTNGTPIVTERSLYWNAGGVFWAGGVTTAGTRLP